MPTRRTARFGDLVEAMRRNPGKLNYSTSGAGTILNLGPQMMFDVLKLGSDAAVQVAYKGGGDAAMAVLSREVDFNCGNLTSLIGNLKGGRMRALFTTTPQRWQDIPDVPTVRELGYPQLEAIIGWSALYGPPGMPAEQIAFWREALAKVATDPQWIAGTERIGGMPSVMTPADTAASSPASSSCTTGSASSSASRSSSPAIVRGPDEQRRWSFTDDLSRRRCAGREPSPTPASGSCSRSRATTSCRCSMRPSAHRVKLLHTRHEAATVHMADAWARLTGEVGIALVTGGPGHANAVSALYTARMSESPVVLLSGHAPLAQLGRGAFQEMQQAAMAAPVTKASWACLGADAVASDMAEAMAIARAGRPGPVHLSLPTDALEAAVGHGAGEWRARQARARTRAGTGAGAGRLRPAAAEADRRGATRSSRACARQRDR